MSVVSAATLPLLLQQSCKHFWGRGGASSAAAVAAPRFLLALTCKEFNSARCIWVMLLWCLVRRLRQRLFFLKRVSACVSCNREVVEEEEEEGARIISVQNVLFHVRSMSWRTTAGPLPCANIGYPAPPRFPNTHSPADYRHSAGTAGSVKPSR